MATYNGAKYLRQQLQSFVDQTSSDWELVISDDGSSDSTIKIIKQFQEDHPYFQITLFNGPKQGYAENFLSMLKKYNGQASYFAFADQDDVWRKNKLSKALKYLSALPNNQPNLYCSRTEYIDECSNSYCPRRFSRLFRIKPSFENSLVQCLAGGNTMVFNRKAFTLLCSAPLTEHVPSHDWWLYQLISGNGGNIVYDSIPSVYYRQHGMNLIGANTSILARFLRAKYFMMGDFAKKNNNNLINLKNCYHLLTNHNKTVLQNYMKSKKNNYFSRMWFFYKSGVHRQNLLDNFALFIGVILNRL